MSNMFYTAQLLPRGGRMRAHLVTPDGFFGYPMKNMRTAQREADMSNLALIRALADRTVETLARVQHAQFLRKARKRRDQCRKDMSPLLF